MHSECRTPSRSIFGLVGFVLYSIKQLPVHTLARFGEPPNPQELFASHSLRICLAADVISKCTVSFEKNPAPGTDLKWTRCLVAVRMHRFPL
jgi:hypothetical protein